MKVIVTDINTVPEAQRSEYEQRDGKWYLKIEGDLPQVVEANTKLAEFRDNNIAFMKKNTELETALGRFNDIDPAKYSEYKAKVEEFERAGGVKGPADIEARINAAVTPFQQKLADYEKRDQENTEKLKRGARETELRKVATKAGIADSAVADFIARGERVFNLDLRAVNGDTPLFSKNKPAEALSMEEWATNLAVEAPHLFKPSKGGGAPGSGGPGPAPAGSRIITGADPLEFGRNLEDIAKGNVRVISDRS